MLLIFFELFIKFIKKVMPQNSHHLISRLRWDTLFDSKAQGVALQERLSDWTGFQMQQELSAVFDKFCPAEQTWRIQTLELDLGTIDFDHLETELAIRIRQQLNEKLISLMLYSHQYGSDIEILDEKRSHVQLIRYFLFHGLLPWNYQANDGSVNQILTVQLQNNQEELLAMLKESGLNALEVRRRMAWQFSEPNMIRIITAIEPNVAGQIILFSNELTRIQQKERVVQASSTTDFKKNVWFWVLNYLLTERGTVFNRIQFMKSSIIQMAAHYNMKYDQLFELIELSVAKLSSSLSLQPDFIITLQLLSKENRAYKKKKTSPAEKVEDHWLTLEALFLNQNLRRNAGNVARFNDLVTVLSNQDQVRFRSLLVAFENRAEFWLPLINDLSDHCLKMVFTSLNDSRSVILTESILFLNRLLGSVKQASERNELWYTGLMFLLAHKNESFNETAFLHALVAVLAQKKQRSTMVLLDQLLVAEIPSSLKTLRHTTLYRTLVSVFRMEISRMPGLQFKKHLHQLMELFHLQVKGGGKDRKRFETLKNILENYFMFQPKAFMEALKTTPYQQSLELLLPEAITGKKHTVTNLGTGINWRTNQEKTVTKEVQETKEWLAELLLQPEQFLDFVKKELITEPQLLWLYQQLSFEELLKMIGSQHQAPQPMLSVLGHFYQVLGLVSLPKLSSGEMQLLLFKKVIRAWTSGNWKLIAAENIWNEMIWEVCSKRGVSKTDFLSGMNVQKTMMPPVLQLAFESLQAQDRSAAPADQSSGSKKTLPKVGPVIGKNDLINEPIPVRNAGLVLLNSYISMLLTRLELVQDRSFCNTESQLAAVHYLQYVVTGQSNTEESFLPLNKLLCGVAISQPVPESIDISKAHQELIEGLIMAALSHWPSIGNSSVNGFRGNWLVRDGLLMEKEEHWELTVEKRAYDLLIQKSPFSFSVIKYPWMDKPLHVIWPY
ncbi:contractile injection system tape measure protein [Pedobacter gandavensis]|uniref:contractile injection system tape measure protein n=1 Tax=Pedobacter gandavensis TaxID=2679963 RepID=UPI00292DCF5B|nr:contractile injection system tape measure protein [Pedobacter gandavensis]